MTRSLLPSQLGYPTSIMSDTASETITNVTCPFCGLACDDLVLTRLREGLKVSQNGCSISRNAFPLLSSTTPEAAPRVAGRATTLENAVLAASQLLSSSQAPLIGGLGTDVAGARAMLELADRIGAVVDHMNMDAKLRNLLTLQNSGWITCTLAEVKNRADFVLVIGAGAVQRFPRFLERAVWPALTMFGADPAYRQVVFLGEVEGLDAAIPAHVSVPKRLHCEHRSLPILVAALRALVNDQSLDASRLADSDIAQLQELAARLRAARYGVIAWSAADFNFNHAELTLQTLAELIKDINRDTRCVGLPLGGSDGDFSSNSVQTWQTGFPLRSRYGKQGLDYDPYRYGAEELIAANEVDALVWVSSLSSARTPPLTELPMIVLGPASMIFTREPEVFIPVGTPGIHHGGYFVRADKVVVMRLQQLMDNSLPSVSDVTKKILQSL
ncbi:MAG: hypothetical protein ABIP67_09015 [Burkholderiales bacterium]